MIASYITISRGLLDSMPYMALLALITVGSVGVAILILYVVRRFLGQWRSSADAGVIGGVAAMVLTLFALLLAFGIVTLYDERRAAHSAVAQEAGDLAVVERDMKVLQDQGVKPKPKKPKAAATIIQYICHLHWNEFRAMRNGGSGGEVVSDQIGIIFKTLGNYTPTNRAQTAFYESAVAQLNDAVAQRRSRLQRADNALPFAFAVLLILTAAISIILTCFIKTSGLSRHDQSHAGIEYVLVGSVAFVVAAGLLTALIFEFPFSGPLAISDDPFSTVHGFATGYDECLTSG